MDQGCTLAVRHRPKILGASMNPLTFTGAVYKEMFRSQIAFFFPFGQAIIQNENSKHERSTPAVHRRILNATLAVHDDPIYEISPIGPMVHTTKFFA